ncbi:prolyl-tRNA synthetase associated domain-containing protein [Succinatimonas hippei]|uniref:YbaK/EbsC family protein n=1 Tax=Succinatimonas hippei TaxID=626938 RepID=UPI002010D6E6|nr:YbaK/EbsC family protein [Succinatimonas hippei]MCL1604009.1 prolyl-tRNA synthetase associated domain-containing protein [Succinatimonas hippei]
MKDTADVVFPYPEAEAKNLFVRDDKKRNYYLITVRGDKRVDLKAFRKKFGLRALSFASPADLEDKLQLIPGSVSPFGLLNDKSCSVIWYVDEEFTTVSHMIGIHPNDNTATVWLDPQDLMQIIRSHGNTIEMINLNDCLIKEEI